MSLKKAASFLHMVGRLAIIMVIITACSSSEEPPTSDVACKVIRFTTQGPEANSICSIECGWNHSFANSTYGYGTGIPVPCTWYGHPVTRQ